MYAQRNRVGDASPRSIAIRPSSLRGKSPKRTFDGLYVLVVKCLKSQEPEEAHAEGSSDADCIWDDLGELVRMISPDFMGTEDEGKD